jgi:putative membrane protein
MSGSFKEFMQRWIVTTLAVLVAALCVRGIHYEDVLALLLASLLLGLLNAFIRPLLLLLALPLLFLTLGLLLFFVNAALLYFVGVAVKGFHVDTFGAAFWGGLVVSLVSLVLNTLTGTGGSRVRVKWGKRPPSSRPPGGDGPVIDI